MFFAAAAWLLQINNINMLAAAIAVSNKAKPTPFPPVGSQSRKSFYYPDLIDLVG